MPGRIVVVGASAGGVEALKELMSGIPADLQAPILVVLHLWANGPSYLPHILASASKLPVVQARDETKLEDGHVYVAPPDRHLIARRDHIHVSYGPKENRHRPSINMLFRSAALAYGEGAIGVILTGALDDGTVGLWEIKKRRGRAIVQDPEEAVHADMPKSAIAHVDVDFVARISEIPRLLVTLIGEPPPGGAEVRDMSASSDPTDLTCPECRGVLRQAQFGTALQFQCRVGHTFTAETMLEAHGDSEENALWSAVVALEEGAELLNRLAKSMPLNSPRFSEEADRKRRYASALREILGRLSLRRN